jgi:hypothetical protein
MQRLCDARGYCFVQEITMKRIGLSAVIFLSAAAAVAADLSLPDANPACMERNGPDCVLGTQVIVPSRVAPPSGTPLPPSGIVVIPAPAPVTAPASTLAAPGTGVPSPGVVVVTPALPPGTVSPSALAPAGTVVPQQGVVGAPAPAATTGNVITPSQGSTIISPRR